MNQIYIQPNYPTLAAISDTDADRRQLALLVDETLDAVPDNSALSQLPAIAKVLVGETLGQCAHRGLLPKSAHAGMLLACWEALQRLPEATSVAEFRAAAKSALREVL